MSSLAETMDALMEMGPQGIARFQESLEPEWIEEALEATGTASVRRRKLPAEQAIWLVLGMGLFADRSIVDVVDHLSLVLPGVDSLAKSAVPQARYRVGAEPMEWLFQRVAEAWSDSPGLVGWRGLELYGVDGTCARVQDSDENFEHFGKPGGRNGANDAGYPQLRLAALMNLRTRLLAGAAFGPYRVGEHSLAAEAHGLPPKRISFRSSLLWIRNLWLTAWHTRPGNIPRHLGELRTTLDVLILPERRTERRYPRHVKIKMSNYPRNRGRRTKERPR